jgi:hypothetical protein
MKKFSKQTNSPVGVEKPTEKIVSEGDILKSKIMGLMDDFLRVQTYGPVTRYQVAGTMKVAGKELFAEALVDFLKNWDSKKEVKALQEFKNWSLDWEAIDKRIDFLNSEKTYLNEKITLESMIQRWGDDEEVLLERVKMTVKNLQIEEIENRINLLEGGNFGKISNSIIDVYKKEILLRNENPEI